MSHLVVGCYEILNELTEELTLSPVSYIKILFNLCTFEQPIFDCFFVSHTRPISH